MLTSSTILARQAAQPPVPSVPNLPGMSRSLADRYPKEGEFSHHDEPKYLGYASFGEGQFIEATEWNAIPIDQRQYVRESLDSRCLSLYRRGDRFITIRADLIGKKAELCPMRQFEFEYMLEDDRIQGDDQVKFVVFNVRDGSEAKKVLRRFLKKLIQTGFTIG